MIRRWLARGFGWDRSAVVIARTAFVTTVRSMWDNTRELAGLVLAGIFLLQMQYLFFGQMIAAGEDLAAIDPPVGHVAGVFAAVVAVGAYGGGQQVVQGSDAGTLRPLLLTTSSPRAVALGQSIASYLKLLALVGAFTLIPLLGIGVGARNPLVPLALLLGGLPLAWGGLLVGRAIALAMRTVYRRLPAARAIRFVLVGGTMLVGVVWWLGVVEAQSMGATVSSALSTASIGPLRSYARTMLAPSGVSVAPADVGATVGILFAVIATTAIVVRIEAAIDAWERPSRSTSAGSRSVPVAIQSRSSLRIGWRYLVLGLRDPSRFSHLSVLIIVFASFGAPALTDPAIAIEYAPEVGLVLGTAIAGGAYCLNPLGDDRDQHTLLLTASPTLRPVLHGRGVAGIVLATVVLVLGLGVGLVGGGGFLDGHSLLPVGYLALAPVLFAASVGTALGFGAAVPSYDPANDGGRIHPSTVPTMVHQFGAMLFGAIGAWLVVVTIAGVALLQLAVAWLLFLATICASGYLGYRNAVKRADALTVDQY